MSIKFTDKYPGEVVRALSWKQPYASLMLHGKVETRTWGTKYRGWVLICASKARYSWEEILSISGFSQLNRIRQELDLFDLGDRFRGDKDSTIFLTGKAIAIGYLKDSRPMGSLVGDRVVTLTGLHVENISFVKIDYNLFLHEYMDVQAIVPFDWKGTQGWKTLDSETLDKIVIV